MVAGCWAHHWVYWAGPLGGGVAAALLYQLVLRVSPGQDIYIVSQLLLSAKVSLKVLRACLFNYPVIPPIEVRPRW